MSSGGNGGHAGESSERTHLLRHTLADTCSSAAPIRNPKAPYVTRALSGAFSSVTRSFSTQQPCIPSAPAADYRMLALTVCCTALVGMLCTCWTSASTLNGSPFEQLKLAMALLAAFLLGLLVRSQGSINFAGMMQRRLAASTELLYDMMPRHGSEPALCFELLSLMVRDISC